LQGTSLPDNFVIVQTLNIVSIHLLVAQHKMAYQDLSPCKIQHGQYYIYWCPTVLYSGVRLDIQGYYRSVVSDEDVARVQMLLELLFIRSGV